MVVAYVVSVFLFFFFLYLVFFFIFLIINKVTCYPSSPSRRIIQLLYFFNFNRSSIYRFIAHYQRQSQMGDRQGSNAVSNFCSLLL